MGLRSDSIMERRSVHLLTIAAGLGWLLRHSQQHLRNPMVLGRSGRTVTDFLSQTHNAARIHALYR
jgi:hypothetical protein